MRCECAVAGETKQQTVQEHRYKETQAIWWCWEPNGGLGKTTFQKWIFQEYDRTIVIGGEAADMKERVLDQRLHQRLYLFDHHISRALAGISRQGVRRAWDI